MDLPGQIRLASPQPAPDLDADVALALRVQAEEEAAPLAARPTPASGAACPRGRHGAERADDLDAADARDAADASEAAGSPQPATDLDADLALALRLHVEEEEAAAARGFGGQRGGGRTDAAGVMGASRVPVEIETAVGASGATCAASSSAPACSLGLSSKALTAASEDPELDELLLALEISAAEAAEFKEVGARANAHHVQSSAALAVRATGRGNSAPALLTLPPLQALALVAAALPWKRALRLGYVF